MRKNNETAREMYGISRIDDEQHNVHAWRVSLSRRGKRFVKNFPDKKYNSRGLALCRAIAFRDQLVEQHPPLTRREFCNTKRRNNKSGMTGVYTYSKSYRLKDGSVREIWYWEANWPDSEGNSVSKAFSVKRYGEETAKRLALGSRLKGLEQVSGCFWASKRGERKEDF